MGVKAEDDPKNKAANLARELQFFERVKARLRNRDTYQEFLKCLHLFNLDVISKMELRGLVYDVLGRYPELLTGFDDFLQRCESMDFELAEAGRGKLSSKDVAKMKIISAREKFLSRPISELDLSMCERCGPSYRLLPKGFPKAPASTRNELHMSVLNDNWVSVTSGSEDFSFKAMRKNQYEESLFRCEDDRFEMDMVIETNAAVLHVLSPLYAQVQAMSQEERNMFRVADDLLSPVHLRSVERIYGADHGPDVRELLVRAPALAILGVVPRLAQKDAEWRRVREDMRRVWAEVYEKNYSKSLDHRSFYFKQADKKSLSAKGMLSEMKELSDKRKSVEEVPMGGSGAPGARARGPSPDVTFSYGDRAVHDDVYAVVKFSSAEMMGDDAAAKLLQFWRSFVEPFFAVARPTDGSPGYLDDVAERAAAAVLLEAKEEEAKEKDEAARGGGSGEDGDGGDAMDTDAPAAPAGAGSKEDGAKHHHRSTGLAAAAADDDDGGEEAPAGRREEREEGGDGAASSGADEEEECSAGRRGSLPEEDAGDAGAQARLLAGCRPLACAVDGDAGSRPDGGRIFYGHDAFFLLFRLHRHLYERIAVARASAAAKHDAAWGPTGSAAAGGAGAAEKDAHSEFLHLLFRLLSGSVEASRYEDDCRALLGANSYVLFTLDKLIYKLIKQVQALLSDDTATRLLLLHDYEGARLRAPSHDAQYAANAGVLLHDEPCFRVASADAGATLTMQLLESAPAGDKAGDGGGGMLEARFADYLRGFLQTAAPKGAHKRPAAPPAGGSSDEEEPQERQVFLARSVAPPGTVSCVNGLECKVSCATSKVSYVLDTEDVLRVRRATSRNADAARQASVSRFHAWLETKVAAAS
jgi:paired amphipathic helix protein Sin3a